MPYLNLDVNYFDHIKTVRLIGLLGKGAAELPIRLWAYCGKHRAKDGNLADYSAQEIESIVGWMGKTGECVEALIKVGFLDRTKEGFEVHDWQGHEGHLISFHERAKVAAKARWNATSIATSNAPTIPTVLTNQPTTHLASGAKHFSKPEPEEVTAYARSINFELDGNEFCDYYESKGWRIGNAPMRDWKASVRTWKRKHGGTQHGVNERKGVLGLSSKELREFRDRGFTTGLRKVPTSPGEVLNSGRNLPISSPRRKSEPEVPPRDPESDAG